jgi:hypothetical protein
MAGVVRGSSSSNVGPDSDQHSDYHPSDEDMLIRYQGYILHVAKTIVWLTFSLVRYSSSSYTCFQKVMKNW